MLRVPYKGEWRDEARNGKVYLGKEGKSRLFLKKSHPKGIAMILVNLLGAIS